MILVPYFARLARTATEGVVPMPFVEAARAAGGTSSAIMLRYVLPAVFSPVIVYATTLIGLMIVVGSGLSSLGLGVQPPTADWAPWSPRAVSFCAGLRMSPSFPELRS